MCVKGCHYGVNSAAVGIEAGQDSRQEMSSLLSTKDLISAVASRSCNTCVMEDGALSVIRVCELQCDNHRDKVVARGNAWNVWLISTVVKSER